MLVSENDDEREQSVSSQVHQVFIYNWPLLRNLHWIKKCSHEMQMMFNGFFIPLIWLQLMFWFWFTGSMQQRKTTLQVLSPATASQRSTSYQRAQPLSSEKCLHATNGNGTTNTNSNHPPAQPVTADGELFMIIDVRSPRFKLKIHKLFHYYIYYFPSPCCFHSFSTPFTSIIIHYTMRQ